MAAPGMISLSKDSLSFVGTHFRTFLGSLVFVFPLMLLLAIVKQAMLINGLEAWLPVTFIPSFYLYACFVLGWHRVSLTDGGRTRAVNPFLPTREDAKFILLFMGVTGVFSILMTGLSFLTQGVLPGYGDHVQLAGNVAAIIVIVAMLYLMIRLSFLFPAKSVGVSLSIRDVFRASHRLTWPLLGSTTMFIVLFVVIFTVYTLIAGMIATVAGGDSMSRVMAASIGFVLSAPVHFAVFFLTALYTTALSRAYQWGMQNNPV